MQKDNEDKVIIRAEYLVVQKYQKPEREKGNCVSIYLS